MRKTNLYGDFEQFLLRLFKHYDFRSERAPDGSSYDILLMSDQKKILVEAKLYRYGQPNRALLLNAIARLEKAKTDLEAYAAIIVTTISLLPEEIEEIDQTTIVYDLPALIFLTKGIPKLWEELTNILLELNDEFDPQRLPAERPVSPQSDVFGRNRLAFSRREIVTTGADLCSDIRRVSPSKEKILVNGVSKSAATVFEQRVLAALQYLFGDHLRHWQVQKKSDTEISKYDAVAKIISNDPFWLSLITDFRTRYILFEFKNFSSAISQTQIFTTERYLYPPAMRSTAIIISRNGANKSAVVASKGALREAGKLIIIISMAELCSMLHAKDRGDDPTLILGTKVDEMLIRIER